MRWFEGPITTAITQAKQQRVLFVVYIYGDDDESKKMTSTWEDTAVAKVCEETKLIAMKFHSGSDECKQFSQFYPVLCVPSVSLIAGQTGVPLEGVAGYATPEDFAAKIKKVNQCVNDGASSPVSNASVPVSKATASPGASTQPQTEAEKKESLQDRAARLRQKMEAVHQQKEAKKQEEQRGKEMERRKMGQAVQKQQQQRATEEAKKAAEEMRKEKMEDKLAKQRVREQIARDRAEKNARFAAERKEREQTKTDKATPAEQREKPKVNMDIARIQFRLPNGSAVTNQFPSSSTLQEAHDFLLQHVGDSLKQFTFSTTFPRRQFTSSDLSRTLLELELAPSAALVVLPGVYQSTPSSQPNRAVASSSGGSVLMWLFSPLLFIWNLLYSFLFGSSRPSGGDSDPSGATQEQTQQTASPESTGARPKSSQLRRRTPGGDGGSSYKRDGNIHRLVANSDEDDEDNNTWNGNSTQQM